MGKAARLQHRVERREAHGIVWPPPYVVGVIVFGAACAVIAYVILDAFGPSWMAPANEGFGGRIPGVLVALSIGVLAVAPLVVVLGRRLRRQQASVRRR
jgi:hypothetical protein